MSSNTPAIVAKITAYRQQMTFLENEIANFILENPDVVTGSTITVLANEVGVSEASINRFCKKIGFKGFNDFKIAVAQDNYYRSMQNRERSTRNIKFVESLSFDYNELINMTTSMIKEETIEAVVELIEKVDQIYIVGFLESVNVANHLKYQLMLLGLHAEVFNDIHLFRVMVSKCTNKDLIIVISETGRMKNVNNVLYECQSNNANIVAMTSFEASEIINIAQETIIIPNRLSINSNSLISSYISYYFVVDCLIGKLIKSNKKYMKQKISNEGIITSTDFSLDNL